MHCSRPWLAASAIVAVIAGTATAQDSDRTSRPIPSIIVSPVSGENAPVPVIQIERQEPPKPEQSPILPPLTVADVPQSIRPKSTRSSPSIEPGLAKPSGGLILPASIVTPSGINITRPPAQFEETVNYDETLDGLAVRAPSFIDQALPMHVVRLRADGFWGVTHPDRAEYFWPRQGFLRNVIGYDQPLGPPLQERSVDMHEGSFYVEVLLHPRISFFTDVPIRSTNPEINGKEAGLGDIGFGVKCALFLDSTHALSFQLRGIAPSGEGIRGLGTESWIVEPALLWQHAVTDRITMFAEVRDRIPIEPRSDFAGNILRYGIGGSIIALDTAGVRVMPTVEAVGWTIMSGKESAQFASADPLIQSSYAKTIVTVNYGVRFAFGHEITSNPYLALSDFYVGYGQAYTNDRWYRDIVRLEYRLRF